jgi:hypothetical protein
VVLFPRVAHTSEFPRCVRFTSGHLGIGIHLSRRKDKPEEQGLRIRNYGPRVGRTEDGKQEVAVKSR